MLVKHKGAGYFAKECIYIPLQEDKGGFSDSRQKAIVYILPRKCISYLRLNCVTVPLGNYILSAHCNKSSKSQVYRLPHTGLPFLSKTVLNLLECVLQHYDG